MPAWQWAMGPCILFTRQFGDFCIIGERLSQRIADAIARAVALHDDGRLDEAAALYRDILRMDPGQPRVLHNLAVVTAQAGEPAEALVLFDQAIAGSPDYVHAHVNRGGALQSLGRLEDAAAAYGRALALQPDLYPVQLRRALVLLALGDRAGALAHFRHTHAQRRSESTARTCRLKMLHDAAQLHHLGDEFKELADLHQQALDQIKWPADDTAPVIVPANLQGIGHDHLAAAPEVEMAVNPELPVAAICEAYGGEPAMAVMDQLLTPAALDGLRRYLLESTIWYDFSHIGGFLAAYLEDGLACPLLLQIVHELRQALPDILGDHPLRQAWAFKCLTGDKGIDIHRDSGAVSVNLWLTPEDSNLAPGGGGLVMHQATPPAGLTLTDYHGDMGEIQRMLADSRAPAVTVAYAEGRAVLFRSNLFHQSGPVSFRPDYPNHRINLTLLFGDQPL